MPKPHHGNRQPAWSKEVVEYRPHDRDRRTTFKFNRVGGRKDNARDWSQAIREHFQDEDVDMGVTSTSGRVINQKYNNNKKKKGRKGPEMPVRKLLEGPTSWYRVFIPYGNKLDKNLICKLLSAKLEPLTFWPIAWQAQNTACSFYVDEFKVAERLHSLDRQILLPNGFKMVLKVNHGSPNVDMTAATKEKMKLAMAKRYNAVTKALDLTKFHADPDLQDCFCALFKPIVFLTVLEVIEENIPELEALNLFDNKIAALGFLKKISKKLPNLKILHMGNNKIRDMQQLDVFQGLPVIDLVLDGNPLCDKFKDQQVYISEVRKRFPKCMKLDGVDLPPPISFDINEEHHLPNPQQTFLCNADGGVIVRQFLEQYFLIYDTDNRQPLLQAYHENAMFSMNMAYPYGLGRDRNVSYLDWYATDNRNLLRVQDGDRRVKLLKQGQLAVVSFLQEMPSTKHDMNSFTVDLTIFTPQMLCLTVSGMFKELKTGRKFPPLRFFFRTLVIVPAGSGFCIVNEVLHVSNATPEQAKGAFKAPPIVAPPPSPVSLATSPGPSVAPAPTPLAPDDNIKQEMVKQMSAQSGMNLEWSLKCLQETEWDFQRASLVFQDLHSKGVIPPEAFVK